MTSRWVVNGPIRAVLGFLETRVKFLFTILLTFMILPMSRLPAETQPSATATSDQAAVVEGNNAFAIDLYNQLRTQSGNLFFSPDSISTALAMTFAGARGDTATEMAKTLHFTLPPQRLHPAMGGILSNLNAPHDGYQLRLANALWAQQGYTFLDDFLNVTKSDYGAGLKQVDFKDAPETARLTINQWVEQQTEDKIKDLLQPGILSNKTKLVLTNAIYFKGDWQTQFDKAQTMGRRFSPVCGAKCENLHDASRGRIQLLRRWNISDSGDSIQERRFVHDRLAAQGCRWHVCFGTVADHAQYQAMAWPTATRFQKLS